MTTTGTTTLGMLVRQNFPVELQDLAQWVLWKYEQRPGEKKPTKVPYNAKTGAKADTTEPLTWATFDDACTAFERGGYDGIGFVVTDDDPYVGIDLDGCIVNGELTDDANRWLISLDSYTEMTPSMIGVRALVKGKKPGPRCKNKEKGVEIYETDRFFTVTGNRLVDLPATINERQAQLAVLYNEVFPLPQQSFNNSQAAPSTVALSMDDQELLERMLRKNARVQSLWDGDTSAHNGDDSGADLALCNDLAYYTNRDAARIDRLFRQSGLYRPKWERADYRKRTIDKAIAGTTGSYDPMNYRSNTNGHSKTSPVQFDHSDKPVMQPDADAEQETVSTRQNTIIDELGTIEGDAEMLKQFALDNSDRVAKLTLKEFLVFRSQLKDRGVPAEWIRSELKPIINEERRAAGTACTWTHYVETARHEGFTFRLNDLDDELEVNGERVTDVLEAKMLSYLHAKGLRSADVARRAFLTAAAQSRYHPIKEYLERLKWDGRDHIARLAQHFTDSHSMIIYPDGTQRTAFHAFQRRWFIGAVAKVYDPKRGQNAMLILDGDQGKGKSFYVQWLCPLPDLHFEGAIRPDDKDYLRYLTTRWIWEVGELGATMRRADREALKAFVTLQEATYRPAFGQYPLHKPALASFIGTVNLEGELLNDPTGHRRFWPVNLTSIDWAYQRNVDITQVWAQAYALYRAGEPWQLTEEERQAHRQITATYEVEDIIEGHVREWFDIQPGNADYYTHTTKILDVLKTFASVKGSDKSIQMQLATTLKKMGLEKQKRDTLWGYVGIRRKAD